MNRISDWFDRNRSWVLTGIVVTGIVARWLKWITDADFNWIMLAVFGPVMTHKTVQQIKEKQ